MKTWKRENYTVVEKEFDNDLHEFDIIKEGEAIATITPCSLDEMQGIIKDLDNGECVDGWEDGKGNTISINGCKQVINKEIVLEMAWELGKINVTGLDSLKEITEVLEKEGYKTYLDQSGDYLICEKPLTGDEFFNKYNLNPTKIEYEGKTYSESDLSTMDSEDYEEIMEYGRVIE